MQERVDYKWDVFISHATEDKESFARPLAIALQECGIRVWFDEFTLTIGDRLRQSIENGLANSRYGIVVISHQFFARDWPQDELEGLAAKERGGQKVILPVWHEIERQDILRIAPMLAERIAAKSSDGLPRVVEEILKAIQVSSDKTLSGKESRSKPVTKGFPEFLRQQQPIKQYYLLPDISFRRLDNAQRRCRIPASEKVVSMIDCTDSMMFWTWGKHSIVFAESGVYFGDGSISGYFTYQECRGYEFSCREEKIAMGRPGQYCHMYHIKMPTGTMSYLSAFWLPDPDSIVALLQRISHQ